MSSIVILYKKKNLFITILESTDELLQRFGADPELEEIQKKIKAKYQSCLAQIESQKNQFSAIEDLDN